MQRDHLRFMRLAIEEADKAGAEGNMAVGSVVVKGGSVVARGRNLVTSNLDVTAHAETVALREAGPALGAVDFAGCTLYTTFEPCAMCCGAIIWGGVSTLVIGARPEPAARRWRQYSVEKLIELAEWKDKIQVVAGILPQECVDVRRKWEPGYGARR